MLRVGQLVMLIVPGELTTMAGRRLRCGVTIDARPTSADRIADDREAVRTKLIANGIIGNDAYVVIAGPANTYGHYVTTIEEYGVQRYEGASTIFGPCEFSWPAS
jgi:neutral ceramidase